MKWHFIGGIVTLPFILLLSITRIIYPFKNVIEQNAVDSLKKIEKSDQRLRYENLKVIAEEPWNKSQLSVVLPESESETIEFTTSKFSHKSSLHINPYTGNSNGEIIWNETNMHQIRKLHYELLLGGVGTKVVERVKN